ncbi:MAG: bifunctional 4-hydroxy-2-oxoglutarate aldolase/2-dehydro-3-deoxy-phosphogluconate aldolase [Clostridiales bacterium]|nr:bifunctional 4-hydroxy-2-oxoglutarate aldolase/2-dehydro-3-deoxy-phosphogluconate aldolase [Clostridiales bacterium]
MNNLSEQLGNIGLVPVVVFETIEQALPAAKALIDGGLPVMEITLRTAPALDAIKIIKQNYPEVILGAGTVLTLDQAKASVNAGARFIVSPGFDDEVVRWCTENDIVVTPGCVTPTEIMHAMGMGVNILKFFPANVYGGINACKALYGPFRSVKFVPTGGVGLGNLAEYADKHFIHAIGGGWLCSTKDIAAGNYTNITQTVKQSIDILLGFELDKVDTTKEIFTNNIDRAKYYLTQRGHNTENIVLKQKLA